MPLRLDESAIRNREVLRAGGSAPREGDSGLAALMLLHSHAMNGRLLAARERRQLRAIVECLKPANTHFVDLVEPLPRIFADDWEIGVSELGATSWLH